MEEDNEKLGRHLGLDAGEGGDGDVQHEGQATRQLVSAQVDDVAEFVVDLSLKELSISRSQRQGSAVPLARKEDSNLSRCSR
eukprot:751683-Hanusia_phi.AAC.4